MLKQQLELKDVQLAELEAKHGAQTA